MTDEVRKVTAGCERCDGCGAMISKDYEVRRGRKVYHSICVPLKHRPVRRNPYAGTRPKENPPPGEEGT